MFVCFAKHILVPCGILADDMIYTDVCLFAVQVGELETRKTFAWVRETVAVFHCLSSSWTMFKECCPFQRLHEKELNLLFSFRTTIMGATW